MAEPLKEPVVRTHPVRVRIYARNGATIEGLAHIKPGAYQRRFSDILNLGQLRYIPITEATYELPGLEPVSSECVLVNVADIVMVDAAPPRPEDAGKQEPPLPGASL